MNRLPREIRSTSGVVLPVIAALLLAAAGINAQAQDPPSTRPAAPAGNADNGKKLYKSVGCYQCHGYSGQGGRAGSKLVPNLTPFPAFAKYVRAPAGEMPPYTTKVVSDAQMADIYAFLKSIPPPRDVKDIPLLNKKDDSKQ